MVIIDSKLPQCHVLWTMLYSQPTGRGVCLGSVWYKFALTSSFLNRS